MRACEISPGYAGKSEDHHSCVRGGNRCRSDNRYNRTRQADSAPCIHIPRLDREIIDTLIFCVPCVSFDPVKMDRVLFLELIELFPEIHIFHRLLRCGFPPSAFPPRHPFLQPFEYILRIRVQLNRARTGQRGKSLDHSGEFHAVVGGVFFAAVAFDRFAGLGVTEQKRPPPGSRIPRTRTIGVEFDGRTGSDFLFRLIFHAPSYPSCSSLVYHRV